MHHCIDLFLDQTDFGLVRVTCRHSFVSLRRHKHELQVVLEHLVHVHRFGRIQQPLLRSQVLNELLFERVTPVAELFPDAFVQFFRIKLMLVRFRLPQADETQALLHRKVPVQQAVFQRVNRSKTRDKLAKSRTPVAANGCVDRSPTNVAILLVL